MYRGDPRPRQIATVNSSTGRVIRGGIVLTPQGRTIVRRGQNIYRLPRRQRYF